MNSDSEAQNGFYPDYMLPVRLAERAARVTDDAEQLSLSAFRSSESLELCIACRKDLRSKREILQDNIRMQAHRAPVHILRRFDGFR